MVFSIHAPTMEAIVRGSVDCPINTEFQFTPPLREAILRLLSNSYEFADFNSRPHKGGDFRPHLKLYALHHFNSHLPCGRRLLFICFFILGTNFNSHLPCGRRFSLQCRKELKTRISIRVP